MRERGALAEASGQSRGTLPSIISSLLLAFVKHLGKSVTTNVTSSIRSTGYSFISQSCVFSLSRE